MRTLVDIRDALMKEAMEVSGRATKRETVEIALQELIKLRQRESLKAMVGKEPLDLTLKELRASRRSRATKHTKIRAGK